MVTEKRCVHCGVVKPSEQFWKSKTTKDGLQSWCKECCKSYPKRHKSKSYIEDKDDKKDDSFFNECWEYITQDKRSIPLMRKHLEKYYDELDSKISKVNQIIQTF